MTRSSVRRERMGHIKLASPVTHIWFLRSVPSRIGVFIDAPIQKLTRVVYYAAYIITAVNEENRNKYLQEIKKELKSKKQSIEKERLKELDEAASAAESALESLAVGRVINETEYHNLTKRFSGAFEAQNGAEAIYNILKSVDLKKKRQK